MIMVPVSLIDASHAAMFMQVRASAAPSAGQPAAGSLLAVKNYDSLRDARNAFEREYIGRKLREHNWNVSRTADDLQIERSHLHRKIKLLNIELRSEG
jgi:two-component system nitrogen regulation response regulator NtrX